MVVASWTGGHADALRQALRMSNEAFAGHLGVGVRTVANWRARPEIVPQPSMQEILDVALEKASEVTRSQFKAILERRKMSCDDASPWNSLSDDSNFGEVTPDDNDRLVMAVQEPARVDFVVVDSLATILAIQRRLDDTLGPAAIFEATRAQSKSVTELLRNARGPERDALAPVAAEWVQFDGWLHAELRADASAARILTQAEEMADDAGDGTLAAQAANFKGYLARHQGRPRGIVRHFLTAYNTPGAHPAQRLGDAVQAAHGYALLGEAKDARHLLTQAEALEGRAARGLPPDTAYWLTPDFQRLNMGLALLALGENAAAADYIAAGLDSLPADQQSAEWTKEYREALAEAQSRT